MLFPFKNYQVTNLSELRMSSVLSVWSQDSENQVSVYLSRESCVCYPYPFHGVIFMVDGLNRFHVGGVFSQLLLEPTQTAGALC